MKQGSSLELLKYIVEELNSSIDLDKSISDILPMVGKFNNVDRVYVFTREKEKNTFSNIYEWCSAKTKPFIKYLQKINFAENFPWVLRRLEALKPVVVNNLNDVPKSEKLFIAGLKKEKTSSLLFIPISHKGKLLGFLGADRVKTKIAWDKKELSLFETISNMLARIYIQKETDKKESQYQEQLELMLLRGVEASCKMLEQRDLYTSKHQHRVALLATAIAKEMDLSRQQIVAIYLGGLLHDIGKIHVPSEILNMPRRLSVEEYALIKRHPECGYYILQNVPFFWPIQQIVAQHHERLDGSGYPLGVKGNKISLEAKVVAVADVFESMTSHRPYRAKRTKNEAMYELKHNAGRLYEPAAVKACMKIVNKSSFKIDNIKIDQQLLGDSYKAFRYLLNAGG